MIVSSGDNIAGPEVEAALLSHPAVAECGVVGAPDEARGMIVKVYVVLPAARGRRRADAALQDHVKQRSRRTNIRVRSNMSELPKTETGKLQALCVPADGGGRAGFEAAAE